MGFFSSMAREEQQLRKNAAIVGVTAGTGVTAERFVDTKPRLRIRRDHWGYVFIAPWIVGFLLFQGGPLVASLYYSLTEYDVLSSPKFVGMDNYHYALTGDPLFWESLWRTSYFALLAVPLGLIGSILLALLLNQGLHGSSFFRTFFYIPSLTPAVAMAILWSWLLHPTLGFANQVLKDLHLPPYAWLTDKDTVVPTLVMISLWAGVGGNMMLIFLAALQGVPRSPGSFWRSCC
jgi:multiple sugar transport system permease protein